MAYTVPTAADFKAIYPDFAAVEDATVMAWINRVNGRDVDTSWLEADFAPAIEAAAAHRMVLAKIPGIAASAMAAYAAAGVTEFQSGRTFSVKFNDDVVKRAASGEWDATSYGVEYLALLRKNKGGPRVSSVPAPVCGYPFSWPSSC